MSAEADTAADTAAGAGRRSPVLTPRAYRAHLEGGDPVQAPAGTTTDAATVHFDRASPIIGVALHASHHVRKDIVGKFAIDGASRRYEEDPFTERFLRTVPHALVANRSRYEVDLNRPPHAAVYRTPEMAWGVDVWREPLTAAELEHSLETWYAFHSLVDAAVEHAIDAFGRAVVLDVHSYNYQRDGPTDWRTDDKPVINLGTKYLELDPSGRALVDAFLERLGRHTVLGEPCLVQENAVFMGGYLHRRLSRTFGPRCITLSIEWKKVFMDEATGQPHEDVLEDLNRQFDEDVAWLAGEMGTEPLADPRVPGEIHP